MNGFGGVIGALVNQRGPEKKIRLCTKDLFILCMFYLYEYPEK